MCLSCYICKEQHCYRDRTQSNDVIDEDDDIYLEWLHSWKKGICESGMFLCNTCQNAQEKEGLCYDLYSWREFMFDWKFSKEMMKPSRSQKQVPSYEDRSKKFIKLH